MFATKLEQYTCILLINYLMNKIMFSVRTGVYENINKLADKVEEQTGEMADFKEKVNR